MHGKKGEGCVSGKWGVMHGEGGHVWQVVCMARGACVSRGRAWQERRPLQRPIGMQTC